MSFGDIIGPPGGSSYRSYLFDEILPENWDEAYFVEKRDPKGRTIYVANGTMAIIQQRFGGIIAGLRWAMPHAHCGAGRSIATNAAAHRGNRYFFLMDMRAAYQSTPLEGMARELTMIMAFNGKPYLNQLKGYDHGLARCREWLKHWCFLPNGGLITGANAAPGLFNLYASCRLDDHLDGWLADQGITYTRYMDDLTFSARRPITRNQRRHIREVLAEAGFEESHHKTKVGLDITKGPIEITGVMIDADGRIFPSKRKRTRATGMIAAALAGKVSLSVAHGHVGACYQALEGDRESRMTHPSIAQVRNDQLWLLIRRTYRSDG